MAGVVCSLTACCYAELSGMIRSTGSSYAFAYHGLGEIFSVVAGMLLSLEYALSGAAVARAWGDKVGYLLSMHNLLGILPYD